MNAKSEYNENTVTRGSPKSIPYKRPAFLIHSQPFQETSPFTGKGDAESTYWIKPWSDPKLAAVKSRKRKPAK